MNVFFEGAILSDNTVDSLTSNFEKKVSKELNDDFFMFNIVKASHYRYLIFENNAKLRRSKIIQSISQ